MDVFNDTHRQIRDTVERFIARHVTPHIQDWEEAGQFPRELYQQAAQDGILGIGYPDTLGGCFEGDVLA
ncbi:MAG: acyl-CoA dehydrogenase family protein, partial [Gammaproteobacteria bacterium]